MIAEPHPLHDAELPGKPSDRRIHAAVRLAVCVLGPVLAYAMVRFIPVSLCGLKLWTGYPCPGCGMTRSVAAIAQGDVAASWWFHPLGPFLAIAVVAAAVGALLGLARGSDPVWRAYGRHGHWLVTSFVGALFVVWVVRVFVAPEWSPDPIP